MFTNKSILITGGTGSFGYNFVQWALKHKFARIIIFSRDEMKQYKMQCYFENNAKLRFFIGDVRDKDRLRRALDQVDFVVHAAATKIVPVAEYNPFECIKTNVIGAMNLIDACIDAGVKKCVALSTDKASSPVNLYGASKLASDKLFIAGNHYTGGNKNTRFSVVRYGNVLNSRGSVIPFFQSLPESEPTPITHPEMTRFMITLDQGIDLVNTAFSNMKGGEVFVKKIPSMKVLDIAKVIRPNSKIDIIGIRPGEKIHEQMIGEEDAFFTYEYDNYYKILPAINGWYQDSDRISNGIKVAERFTYKSNTNQHWMSEDDLKNLLFSQ
jgi:UDP-N-acetylglucosamine 4,6-dehydratase